MAAQRSNSPASAKDCRIGGSPALDLPRVPRSGKVRLTSPVEVVGCSQSPDGEIQLVAYGTSAGLCISEDLPALGASMGGACKPKRASWTSYCRHVCVWRVGKAGTTAHTFVIGGTEPRAQRVTIEVGNDGRPRVKKSVAEVSGGVLSSLGQSERFSVFGAVLPICANASSIKVEALDAENRAVGSAAGGLGLPRSCPR